MEIDKEDLIEMMREFWAVDNNATCYVRTLEFCLKYGISRNEISIGADTDFDKDDLQSAREDFRNIQMDKK